MKYNSKLKAAIQLFEKKLSDVEKELAEFLSEKNKQLQQFQKEDEKRTLLLKQIEQGGVADSSSFSSFMSMKTKSDIQNVIDELDEKIATCKKNYLELKKKRDFIIEKDKEREKDFYKELDKKEEKKIEDFFQMKTFGGGSKRWK